MPNVKAKAKSSVRKPASKKSTVKKTGVARRVAPANVRPVVTQAVGFRMAIGNFFKRYFDFYGTATRAEYWWAVLFNLLVLIIGGVALPYLFVLLAYFGVNVVVLSVMVVACMWAAILYGIAIFIPTFALMARRLHDAGFSAWVFFIPWGIVNVFGWIVPSTGFWAWVVTVLGLAVSVCGIVFALIPSKIKDNPYRGE